VRVSLLPPLDRREKFVLLALPAGIAVWLLLPLMKQSQAYHQFADRRAFLGVPNAADVLSNLGFVVAGLVGLWWVWRGDRPLEPVVRAGLLVFFAGIFLTGFGSAYYHWEPSDARLVFDRLPMTVAFAGVYGVVLAERVSSRSGLAALILMLLIGPASVVQWAITGDLALYALVQFGGMIGLLVVLSLTRAGSDALPWWALVGWYIVAKLAEAGDAVIWRATGETVAGHAIKHLAAAMGALAIALAMRAAKADGPRARA
jgi:hypothetical protein